ncbi:MAG: hypothetical protein H6578_00215 [Chitinophagales bacterium]|nr:hypothetical protein [Chitinophagales bacterium]
MWQKIKHIPFIKIKVVLFCFFVVNIVSNLTLGSFFPSLLFPHFPNHSYGNEQIPYNQIKYTINNKPYDFMELVNPYDKRFYLFFNEFAGKEKYSKDCVNFLNVLYREKYNTTDTIKLEVTQQYKDIRLP